MLKCSSTLMQGLKRLSILAGVGVMLAGSLPAAARVCNFASPSLDSTSFNASINGYLQNNLGARGIFGGTPATFATVNSANFLQNFSLEQFANQIGSGAAFNLNLGQNFPPTGTANLPRLVFETNGILRFYITAAPLTAAQLQGVQNVYAQDLVSRRNYALNVLNLARIFTFMPAPANGSPAPAFALNALRSAYNTLSNPALPAPDPRELYRKIATAFIAKFAPTFLDPNTVTFEQLRSNVSYAPSIFSGGDAGVHILGIGLANYDTNRLPVINGSNAPTPSQCAGCFPLADFDSARFNWLTAAQAIPDQVFGTQVRSYLARFGITQFTNLTYQVNSADQIQAVTVLFPASGSYLGNGQLTILFKNGVVPSVTTTDPALLPEFSFFFSFYTHSTNRYLLTAANSAARQTALATYYANPANAARRSNYVTNLNNIKCNLQQLAQRLATPPTPGGTDGTEAAAIQGALNVVNNAFQTLANGALPDVLNVYRSVAQAVEPYFLNAVNFEGDNDPTSIRSGVASLASLVPIGVINYYMVPITLGGIN